MRILAVTGASGGHIYPALAFLDRLKAERDITDALLVLPSRSIKLGLNSLNFKISYISCARLSFSFSRKSVIALLAFVKGAWESLRIFMKFNPDIVVGFGSADSIPLIMIAWFFRVKTLIHEQNVLPGRANRFLAKFSDKVAISFQQSIRYFNLPKDKIVLTGNPIRSTLNKINKEEARSILGLDKDKFTILVMGGSQGSKRINSVFIKALGLIKEKQGLQVIHLTGEEEYDAVIRRYNTLGIKAKVFIFLKEIGLAYSAADLAVSRAGATTLSELMYFGLTAIIIPYPFAYSHQSLNADILKKDGLAFVIDENSLHENSLKLLLEDLILNPRRLVRIGLRYERLPRQDHASLLVNAVFALI
jgi:UDP-N-acetylglucosamine--N-acetylmuramyl-(pentapeptide) pyrophosphoryl-undecaprenol N-acetylglucosamine transferase